MTNEFQSMVVEEAEAYTRMEKKPNGKLKPLLLLVAATLIIMIVMVFVVFCYQQRKFADLENSMRNQNCSLKFEMNAGTQTRTLSDIQTLINTLSSSLRSLSTNLETKLQDMDSQRNMLSDINTSVSNLASFVNFLSSKLQRTDQRVMKLLSDLSDLRTELENSNKTTPLCKTGWIQFESKCYFFSEHFKTWDGARNYCRNENGMLVKVETEEEMNFLTRSRKDYWVGLTDETTGEWRWDDGSPFVRNSEWWEEGQPDNWDGHGLGGGEDCAHLTVIRKLNDNHCSIQMRFICQI
ncbi:C-type lectin domain family 10 member A isoform X2 [Pangasianodon hypophthalmus]|uniref:C-type lectin domain family 10 member A isoform X2 n=1 Tax=Pangasianodon hypophthalmus TaxID=310915 RepID=UPI002306EE7C|nr:C-type lectin domain family 10 member A isoform X2 [Pangasianodon hypophthalmus]